MKIFFKKTILVICAILFSLLLLEISLRLGGFIYSFLQEHKNLLAIRRKGTYRIMCLGESITAGSGAYPSALEEILNQRNTGIEFSVVNKGLPFITTDYILEHLQENLDQCQPDMVTAMIGANDYYVKYYEGIPDTDSFLFRNSRAYRLFRILCMHITNRIERKNEFPVRIRQEDGESEYSFYNGPLLEEKNIREVIALNPKNENAYFELGRLYMCRLKFSEAVEPLRKVIELNPKNQKAYMFIGYCYSTQQKYSLTAQAFEKAIELNPVNAKAYLELGLCYMCQGRYSLAEKALKKYIELRPSKDIPYGALAVLYREIGLSRLSKEYYKKAEALRSCSYNPNAFRNYHKLKNILDQRKIKLVCIQYPMRNIEPLKKIFEDDDGVIFVDNEKLFRDAVKKGGFKKYFEDMFGGDFGHCTREGNRILAENTANAILKECFGKKN